MEFSRGFSDLHTRVYKEILGGGGYGIEEARPAISLVRRIREADEAPAKLGTHPLLARLGS